MFIQTGFTWRQIISFEQIDACRISENLNIPPYVKSMWNSYHETFSSLPSRCPIKSGKYSAENITIMDESFKKLAENSIPNLPNGIYRHKLSIFNYEDPEGITIEWQVELYDKSNQDEF